MRYVLRLEVEGPEAPTTEDLIAAVQAVDAVLRKRAESEVKTWGLQGARA